IAATDANVGVKRRCMSKAEQAASAQRDAVDAVGTHIAFPGPDIMGSTLGTMPAFHHRSFPKRPAPPISYTQSLALTSQLIELRAFRPFRFAPFVLRAFAVQTAVLNGGSITCSAAGTRRMVKLRPVSSS